MHDVLSLILGGGRGTRLYPLTALRSKPAVPVAGKYRLIDIPISNCINSGMQRIYVLTQFLSVSLHRHIANTYKFDPFSRGFVEVLAAQQTNEAADWYQGTADAVRQQMRYVQEETCEHVLILSGDQLYRMDFQQMLKTHTDSGADATIAVLPVNRDAVPGLGVMKLDKTGKVVGFVEKPQTAEAIDAIRTPAEYIDTFGIKANGREYLASMGIYLFKREALLKMLMDRPWATDFGKEIFPRGINTYHIHGHLFDGYWEDLGTVKAYHEANLALAGENPPFDFHSPDGIIFTRMRFLPASRIQGAKTENCLISDGCVIEEGAELSRCLIGVRSRIGKGAKVSDTIIIGADRFETPAEREANKKAGRPDLLIGEGCDIRHAILDKDVRIGKNVKIHNVRGLVDHEESNFVIRDGIVVIPRGKVIPDDTII